MPVIHTDTSKSSFLSEGSLQFLRDMSQWNSCSHINYRALILNNLIFCLICLHCQYTVSVFSAKTCKHIKRTKCLSIHTVFIFHRIETANKFSTEIMKFWYQATPCSLHILLPMQNQLTANLSANLQNSRRPAYNENDYISLYMTHFLI